MLRADWTVDCVQRTYLCTSFLCLRPAATTPLTWNSSDDSSAVEHVPSPRLDCFIAIPSGAAQVRERDALRQSWLSRFQADSAWDYAFFVGRQPTGASKDTASRLAAPFTMLGDVVQLPVADDYQRLLRKVTAALRWTLDNVVAEYVLKVDTDTWVNAESFSSWIATQGYGTAYGGISSGGSWPVVREGKWAVPRDVYSAATYPTYAKGGGYFLSFDAAARVLDTIESGKTPTIENVEDVTVGLAARFLDLQVNSLPDSHGDQKLRDTKFKEIWYKANATEDDISLAMRVECCQKDMLVYHKPFERDVCDRCAWGGRQNLPVGSSFARAPQSSALPTSFKPHLSVARVLSDTYDWPLSPPLPLLSAWATGALAVGHTSC